MTLDTSDIISKDNMLTKRNRPEIEYTNNPYIVYLDKIDGVAFERLCKKLFERLGFYVAMTQGSHDNGIDLFLYENKGLAKSGKPQKIVQCKHWLNGTVGRPDIQKFHSAVMYSKAVGGIFVTTGTFSKEAYDYIETDNLPIELIDINGFIVLISKSGIFDTIVGNVDTGKRSNCNGDDFENEARMNIRKYIPFFQENIVASDLGKIDIEIAEFARILGTTNKKDTIRLVKLIMSDSGITVFESRNKFSMWVTKGYNQYNFENEIHKTIKECLPYFKENIVDSRGGVFYLRLADIFHVCDMEMIKVTGGKGIEDMNYGFKCPFYLEGFWYDMITTEGEPILALRNRSENDKLPVSLMEMLQRYSSASDD